MKNQLHKHSGTTYRHTPLDKQNPLKTNEKPSAPALGTTYRHTPLDRQSQ